MADMTIKELARICGVAVSTVSRAMNDRSDVNPETRARIRAAAETYGYVPNTSARRLKIGSTKTISVFTQGEFGPLLVEVLQLLEQAFAEAGFDTTISHIANSSHTDAATVERIVREGKFSGVVFLGRYGRADRETSAQLSRRLAEIAVPMVFCTTPDYSGAAALHSSISVDDHAGAHDLTAHLIALGHRRIAFVGAGAEPDREHAWALRLAGYRAALRDAGIGVDDALVIRSAVEENTYSMRNGYESVRAWLPTAPDDVTGLISVCDAAAIGASRALSERGLSVPSDVSLAGFDGLDVANYVVPRLTTIVQPVAEIAQITARVLLATMADPTRAVERVWIRGRILLGESVRAVIPAGEGHLRPASSGAAQGRRAT